MVLEGKLKSKVRQNVYLPYRLDLGLDFVYVRLRNGDPAYSDYVVLKDNGIFKNHYAIVDYDQNRRPIGFTVEGLIDDYRNSSLKNRLIIDFGGLVLQHASRRFGEAVKDHFLEAVQGYIRGLMPMIEPKDRLFKAPAPCYA